MYVWIYLFKKKYVGEEVYIHIKKWIYLETGEGRNGGEKQAEGMGQISVEFLL